MNQLSDTRPNEIAKELIVQTFFSEHPLGVLATSSAEGQPHGTVVYGKVLQDFTTYFVTKESTQKIDNIKSNPNVSFTSYDEERVLCGEIQGEVTIIADPHEIASRLPSVQEVMTEQRQQYWVPPIAQLKAGGYVLCQIKPKMVRYFDFSAYSAGKQAEPRIFEFLY